MITVKFMYYNLFGHHCNNMTISNILSCLKKVNLFVFNDRNGLLESYSVLCRHLCNNLVDCKDFNSAFLFTQGPPGTGKTVTSASVVYHLAKQNNG